MPSFFSGCLNLKMAMKKTVGQLATIGFKTYSNTLSSSSIATKRRYIWGGVIFGGAYIWDGVNVSKLIG